MEIENIVRGICIREGKVLLAYAKNDGHYFLPGGHIEQEESVYHTLEREIKEETGLTASAKDLVLVFEHLWEGKKGTVHEINFIITCEVEDGSDVTSKEPHLEFSWFPLDELQSLPFLPKEVLPAIQAVGRNEEGLHFLSTIK